MKTNNLILTLLLAGSIIISSCSTGKKNNDTVEDASEMNHDMHGEDTKHTEHEGHASGVAEHHHDMSSMEMSDGESMSWSPGGGADYVITQDFHFITGGLENISPQVIQNESGDNLLQLTADGSPTAFVFHQAYGNVGMAAMINVKGFDGTFKLIHHAKNVDNHEFVSINRGNMKLGRIVDGNENVFDEGTFEAEGEWLSLRVSAAGTHYKGYIGNVTVTHGHGDKMQDGYVGILLNGTGKVLIKSIEIASLDDE